MSLNEKITPGPTLQKENLTWTLPSNLQALAGSMEDRITIEVMK